MKNISNHILVIYVSYLITHTKFLLLLCLPTKILTTLSENQGTFLALLTVLGENKQKYFFFKVKPYNFKCGKTHVQHILNKVNILFKVWVNQFFFSSALFSCFLILTIEFLKRGGKTSTHFFDTF